MMKNRRFFFLWCVLVIVMFFPARLPNNSVFHGLSEYASSRWVHFLAYALLATIPVAAWKPRVAVIASFLPAVISVLFQILHAQVSATLLAPQNLAADLFGSAAGILLGLNLRMIRNAGKTLDSRSSATSH